MSAKAELKLGVLWESEVREASRLIMAANDVPDDKEHKDAKVDAMSAAYRACQIALWGIADKPVIMLGADAIKVGLKHK